MSVTTKIVSHKLCNTTTRMNKFIMHRYHIRLHFPHEPETYHAKMAIPCKFLHEKEDASWVRQKKNIAAMHFFLVMRLETYFEISK